MQQKQPWIYSAWFDGVFMLLPPFMCVAAVLLFPSYFVNAEVSVAWWFVLVLCVDVSHVYSTIYRTYSDKEILKKHRTFLFVMPVVLFVAGLLVYQLGSGYFWRILAYIAVFHFIRQQYGFLRIYGRKENQSKWLERIDVVTIYASTLFPIIFWHLRSDRKFHWFVDGDFIDLSAASGLTSVFAVSYVLILALYFVKETIIILKKRFVNVPKNLLVAGTALSWYAGIVLYNGDLVFTMLNVISHGIPYIALVWVYGRKKSLKSEARSFFSRIFHPKFIVVFITILLVLAYVEEGLWDATVWHERESLFGLFSSLKSIHISEHLIVPLLVVPQLTHYVIDGFIWKIKKDNFDWKETTLPD